MLKFLTRAIVRRVGFHTDTIQRKMMKFFPKTLEEITDCLKMIGIRKQYIKDNSVTETFINRIQLFIFNNFFNKKSKKSNPDGKQSYVLNQQVIKIYKIMNSMGLATFKFKHGIYKNLAELLMNASSQGIHIHSNQIQKSMWFIYQQFPYLRDTKFQEIGSDYTLRLFSILEHMNKMNQIPSWQPYIRISVLLKALGHEFQTRSQVNLKTLEQTNYLYYPYLPTIIKTKENQQRLLKSEKVYENFNIYLTNKYISLDKMRYDKYIFYVEQIDNEVSNQSVEKIIDPLTWYNYLQLFQLYAYRLDPDCKTLDNDVSYQICELFWRLYQSNEIELECGIRMLKMLTQNNYLIDIHMIRVIKRIVNTIQGASEQNFKYLAGSAFNEAFQSISKLDMIPQVKKQKIFNILLDNIKYSILWEEGQKQDLLNSILKLNFHLSEPTHKFLTNV